MTEMSLIMLSLLTQTYVSLLLLLFFSCFVVSDSMWPHGLQHTRFLCHSLSPGVCSHSCPLSRWCHLINSSSVDPCPPAFNHSQHQSLCLRVNEVLGVYKGKSRICLRNNPGLNGYRFPCLGMQPGWIPGGSHGYIHTDWDISQGDLGISTSSGEGKKKKKQEGGGGKYI